MAVSNIGILKCDQRDASYMSNEYDNCRGKQNCISDLFENGFHNDSLSFRSSWNL